MEQDVQWFYVMDGQQAGPASADVLIAKIVSGELFPRTQVWCAGMNAWLPAEQVPVLAAGLAATKSLTESDESPRYAGFWKRFAAAILDALILAVPGFVVLIIGFTFLGMTLPNTPEEEANAIINTAWTLWVLGGLLTWVVNGFLLEALPIQGTLGKAAMAIYVANRQGGRLGFGRALGRNLAKVFSAALLGLGFFVLLFSREKQALHDRVTDSVVLSR